MLDRRAFISNSVLSSAGLIIFPQISFQAEHVPGSISNDELESGFLNPPGSAKPQAFWMWMNGHITKKGITLDLQCMKEIGLAGAFIYNTGTGIPKGPVEYGSGQWDEMVIHAMAEAKRLGLELLMHNSPGFSSTGGSWVPPEMSMQQFVWSETKVESAGSVRVQLKQPYTKLGYYKDAFVVAYPSLKVETVSMKEKLLRVLLNEKEIDRNTLSTDDFSRGLEFKGTHDQPAALSMHFSEPFEARAITVRRQRTEFSGVFEGSYDNPPVLLLESSDDGVNYQTVCTISMPALRFMNAPGAKSFRPTKAKYFRLSGKQSWMLTGLELHAGPRLTGWPAKTNFTDEEIGNDDQQLENELIIDPLNVVDVTNKLDADGFLNWNAPAGNWTILRMGHTSTGTRTAGAPDAEHSLEIDKFSKEAVDRYFKDSLGKLLSKLRSFAPKTFKGVLIDSWEIGKQNWTRDFPNEFSKRKNYTIVPWLPALTGRIVKSADHTERFLWDFRKTHADLVADNYYGQFKKRLREFKLELLAQPNGDGVFDSLQVGQHLQTPISEFWTRYVPGTLNICKQAVSIAHGYGKNIVAAEAYTGMPSTSRWTAYPYALKCQGDHIYTLGINRFVFHVFTHQPYTHGSPGMTMGPYGTHFDRNLTWIKQSKGWIQYITRTQFLLQQGKPVADICYFKGEEPASGIPDVNYVNPPTPKNIAGDVIGPDVLLNRIRIENGKIVLPDGMKYSLMIMAPLKTISPAVINKVKELVTNGMILVVTSRPSGIPGLTNEQTATNMVNDSVQELWGQLDGSMIKERDLGKGKIYWNKSFDEVLQKHGIRPDFEFTAKKQDAAIHYTHRTAGDAEIYFVSNHLRRAEHIVCSVRDDGKTPEIWNAEKAELAETPVYERMNGRIYVPLELEAGGSLFVIFRNRSTKQNYTAIKHNSIEISSAKSIPKLKADVFKDVVNDFTITVWVKPDTISEHPKGVIIFPPEAETVYGTGHAACGLAAGQNGVRVFEREKGANREARQMITSKETLEGWTHLALRYEKGRPSLFINGSLVETKTGSGKIIHPGLNTTPTDELFSAYFEGNQTEPVLHNEVLNDETILALFRKGLPDPDSPSPIQLKRNRNKILTVTAWENGNYVLESGKGVRNFAIKGCRIISLQEPWQVRFPLNSGAPRSIELKQLASLHRHADAGVKYFSGTAAYSSSFNLSKTKLVAGQKILLDLGRVETITEVKINGKYLGILWKEPYRIDITKAVIPGDNKMEISVTNLWPNRMIGDEHLPKENEYNEIGLIKKFPDWYLSNKPKPGLRIAFSAWNNFKITDPLLESGLLGPVRMIFCVEKTISD